MSHIRVEEPADVRSIIIWVSLYLKSGSFYESPIKPGKLPSYYNLWRCSLKIGGQVGTVHSTGGSAVFCWQGTYRKRLRLNTARPHKSTILISHDPERNTFKRGIGISESSCLFKTLINLLFWFADGQMRLITNESILVATSPLYFSHRTHSKIETAKPVVFETFDFSSRCEWSIWIRLSADWVFL